MRLLRSALLLLAGLLGLSMLSAGTASAGNFNWLVAQHSQMCVGVPGGSQDHAVAVKQQSCGDEWSKQWAVNYIDNGDYAIVNRNSKKCLDVDRAIQGDNVYVLQANCHYGANQRWKQQPAGGGVLLIAQHSKRCLDVSWASQDEDATIMVSGCWSGPNQQFKITPR